VEKRGNLIEKQKAHEKIGKLWKLDPGNVSNQSGQHKKFGKHNRVPVQIGEN
jgi:hypothetical protein